MAICRPPFIFSSGPDAVPLLERVSCKHYFLGDIFLGEHSGYLSGYSLGTAMIAHLKIRVLHAVPSLAVSAGAAELPFALVIPLYWGP